MCYSMVGSKGEYTLKVGSLVKFVCAPGRWKGEKPRCPGSGVVGKLAIITAGPIPSNHDWGGVWQIFCDGQHFSHWGDFMEPV